MENVSLLGSRLNQTLLSDCSQQKVVLPGLAGPLCPDSASQRLSLHHLGNSWLQDKTLPRERCCQVREGWTGSPAPGRPTRGALRASKCPSPADRVQAGSLSPLSSNYTAKQTGTDSSAQAPGGQSPATRSCPGDPGPQTQPLPPAQLLRGDKPT